MKIPMMIVIVNLTANIVVSSAFASFFNLNFEQANIPAIPPSTTAEVSIVNGMPGWMGFLGTNQVSSVLHNGVTLGQASISILGPTYFPINIIEGQYTALLQAGGDVSGVGFVDACLSQTGLVPATARFLQLKEIGGDFSVSFDGQNIPLAATGSGLNYTLYAGDISAFAGQVGELRVSSLNPLHGALVDSVEFTSVPEPSVLALAAACALVAVIAVWRRQRICK